MRLIYNVLLGSALSFLPLAVFAQGAGGQVRRPVKKQETTSTPAKKRQSSKKENSDKTENSSQTASTKPSAQKPMESKPSNESIIKRLIDNMVYVEGGTFTMGAASEQGSDACSEEMPAHRVMVSSFSIGKYEVTQEEWEAVMGSNPSNFKGAKRPVENVSWSDCRQFIRKLNSLTGKNFRMLTEAEWEFAARGGNKSRGYKYAGSHILDDVGWYSSNSSSTTHDVGQLDPNELGLYDMSGNVWEWCADWYGPYESGAQTNPMGASSGSNRVYRGGSWYHAAGSCRVSYRNYYTPDLRGSNLGLRLAL